MSKGTPILLHFNNHIDYVEWFWSVIAAGGIPVVSTPLASDPAVKAKHLAHLERLLKHPKVLTSLKTVGELAACGNLDLVLVEQLPAASDEPKHTTSVNGTNGINGVSDGLGVDEELAFLMLTSGSTGNAKAVECGHLQTITSLQGKSKALESSEDDVFLNWIGKLIPGA